VYGTGREFERIKGVHIRNLRAKIESDPKNSCDILTGTRWGSKASLRALTLENICSNIRVVNKEVIARVVSEVERIARGVGFGQVTIVIEKGRPRWIEAGTREWLEPREGVPLGWVRPEMQM
jgi:hypothetical protein